MGVGCARALSEDATYNCSEDIAHWNSAWSKAKRKWCCSTQFKCQGFDSSGEEVAESYECTGKPEAWPGTERTWCCKHKHLGCSSTSSSMTLTTTEPFQCHQGLEMAHSGWSRDK